MLKLPVVDGLSGDAARAVEGPHLNPTWTGQPYHAADVSPVLAVDARLQFETLRTIIMGAGRQPDAIWADPLPPADPRFVTIIKR